MFLRATRVSHSTQEVCLVLHFPDLPSPLVAPCCFLALQSGALTTTGFLYNAIAVILVVGIAVFGFAFILAFILEGRKVVAFMCRGRCMVTKWYCCCCFGTRCVLWHPGSRACALSLMDDEWEWG